MYTRHLKLGEYVTCRSAALRSHVPGTWVALARGNRTVLVSVGHRGRRCARPHAAVTDQREVALELGTLGDLLCRTPACVSERPINWVAPISPVRRKRGRVDETHQVHHPSCGRLCRLRSRATSRSIRISRRCVGLRSHQVSHFRIARVIHLTIALSPPPILTVTHTALTSLSVAFSFFT